jgi:hypothetical protein
MMKPIGRHIVGSKCYICSDRRPIHLGLLMDSRIEPYCESCFYCIPEKNRIEITSIEYVESSGPVEYEIILERKNE